MRPQFGAPKVENRISCAGKLQRSSVVAASGNSPGAFDYPLAERFVLERQ